MKNDPMLKALKAMDDAAVDRRNEREVAIYENGSEIVQLSLHPNFARPGAGIAEIQGAAMQMVAANMRSMSDGAGFAMVGGVAFREELGIFGRNETPKQAAARTRTFTGRLGDELKLTVRAQASEAAVMALLTAIDYDRLNAMLTVPYPGVGNDVPVLDPKASRALADAEIRRQDAAQRAAADDRIAALLQTSARIAGAKGDTAVAREVYQMFVAVAESDEERAALGDAIGEAAGLDPAVLTADAGDQAAAPAGGGLFARLSGMLTRGGSGTANKPPVIFKCAKKQGFKSCTASD
jgi:hypothetical protein